MRITLVLLFTFAFQLQAERIYSQFTNISFEMENSTVEKEAIQQQKKTITGKVVDAYGVPIIGANIVEGGTTNGTVTDLDGKFSLSVEDNASIRVSYLGYMEQSVTTVGQTAFNIILLEDTKSLDELVVVGYGVQKKENVTGSVSSIRFDETLANRPITSPAQALGGQMPGIWVSEVSGKPGEDDGVLLRIRGWGSLNSSGPMVLIDGVEGSLAQINPKEIENMTVLKDAASASIYGSKAANGVVLITTKNGNYNQDARIDLSSYVGFQSLDRYLRNLN